MNGILWLNKKLHKVRPLLSLSDQSNWKIIDRDRAANLCASNSYLEMIFGLGHRAFTPPPRFTSWSRLAARFKSNELFYCHKCIHKSSAVAIKTARGTTRIANYAPQRRQAFSRQSQENLSKLARMQEVVVEWHKKDRYGRLVGTVYVKGVDVGLEQVRAGLAWHFKRYENEQTPEERKVYAIAESAARERHLGLWTDPRPVPPWEWREQQRADAIERGAR